MVSEVVQFRLDQKEAAYLRKKGLAPNAAARDALRRFLQRLRMEEAFEAADKRPIEGVGDPARAVREAREELDRRFERAVGDNPS